MSANRQPPFRGMIFSNNRGTNIGGHGVSIPAGTNAIMHNNSFENVGGDMIHVSDPPHLPIPEDLLADLRALAALGVEPKDVKGPIADRLAKLGVDILDWAGRYDTLAKIIAALSIQS